MHASVTIGVKEPTRYTKSALGGGSTEGNRPNATFTYTAWSKSSHQRIGPINWWPEGANVRTGRREVAHKSDRACVRSELRSSRGPSQRECDYLSASLTHPDIICQGLAIRERGSWEDAGVHAANL